MGRLGWLWAAVAAVIAVTAYLLPRRRIRRLTRQVEEFLNGTGAPVDVALGDDDLSRLQNDISDLELSLVRAKQLHREECLRTSRLTADISHQLKTPLTTLRLYAEMDGTAHMDQELDQIQRMENLIHSLLRLERLYADGYPFTFAPAEVESIIAEQWQSLRPLWPEKKLTVEGAAKIHCDAAWLGEAFLNLLKNACEHTGENGEIFITLERTEAVFFCTVEDNGGGVPPQELPRLFDRFYRAEHQSKSGAGIGLAIVREIVTRHHGVISAKNGERGLKITISIPMLDRSLTNP